MFRTELVINGNRHESWRKATTPELAAHEASKAWYSSGVQVTHECDGRDLSGRYLGFTLRHGQDVAIVRVYVAKKGR